uniref:p74 protein n=1 Tax=Helicoverpa armigera nucleopolyhedrovirus TaxID=51313 RepID=A0A0E3JAK1_9ABAC|nr:p74 protein [Helicoverpa armigera nucleopolyhedrovirus]AJP07442.1 p74 protein [Helicoverpa armigera nucleopolyhedrovirus]
MSMSNIIYIHNGYLEEIRYTRMSQPTVPTPTFEDALNAGKFAFNISRLKFIPKWRARFPHIFIDYKIWPANNDDFYVPAALFNRAIGVRVTFSRKGCESMSCYPFHETGPITPYTQFGYTQTSETAVAYAQPACYNLDRAAAVRDGAENEIQTPELRYTDGGKCIIVDTLTKMYLNTPYLRTDDHLIQGVDDVPGFNVTNDTDQLFPERFEGFFNEAYCRRFGRSLQPNGGCSLQWWESLIGFVLGDTVLVSFKLLVNNIFSELRGFDYTRPSPVLPPKPVVTSPALVVQEWRSQRDREAPIDLELSFLDYEQYSDIGLTANTVLEYVAENGFRVNPYRGTTDRWQRETTTLYNDAKQTTIDDQTLKDIITQFLEDNALVAGIAASFGFDFLFDVLKDMLKRINTQLLPLLRRVLISGSRQFTTRLLGETYKAAVIHSMNKIAIKTVTAVAKAMTKIAIKAASVIGIVLIILTISDLVLALWDPFGYSNMFPREFPRDLSNSFLTAFFQSMGENRDMMELLPEYYDDLLAQNENDTDQTMATFEDILNIAEYLSALTVNSNGQMLDLNAGEPIDDFDEMTLVGAALASSAMYTHLEFLQYTERMNKLFQQSQPESFRNDTLLAKLFGLSSLILMALVMITNDHNATCLFVIVLLIILFVICRSSLMFYMGLRKHAQYATMPWYHNLYT